MTLKCRRKIRGNDVSKVFTLGSMYDNNCVGVIINEKIYRLPATVILSMIGEFVFDLDKKQKHTYLTNAEPLNDEHGFRADIWESVE